MSISENILVISWTTCLNITYVMLASMMTGVDFGEHTRQSAIGFYTLNARTL